MSQSPSAAGAMGIGTMLNNKGASSVQDTMSEHQPGQPQLHPQFVMERANSPHGSEHSRYSAPMNTSYPSPTAMGAPLPPVPSANMAPMPHGLPGMPPTMPPGMSPAAMPQPGYKPAEGSQAPPKAFPCSTCGKGFARRSDLARHGKRGCQSPADGSAN